MSSFKFNLADKFSFVNIKIPNNMSQSELEGAIVGAVLFSLAACLYYFVFGKLMGRTSLIQEIATVSKSRADMSIYATVLAGVVFCSAFVKELHHQHYIDFEPFDTKIYIRKTQEAILAVAGLLVGIGTAMAGTCTVGHAISGIARMKKASFLVVIIFSTTAYLTNRYNLPQKIPKQWTTQIKLNLPNNIKSDFYINVCLTLPFLFFVLFKDKSIKGLIKYILNFGIGVLFALGMMVGGMTSRELVLECVKYTPKYWNPAILVFFLCSAVICGVIMSFMIKKNITPVFTSTVENPRQIVSLRLIVGSALFGVGWGLCGLCTAAFYTLIPLVNLKVIVYWGIPCLVGFQIVNLFDKLLGKISRRKK